MKTTTIIMLAYLLTVGCTEQIAYQYSYNPPVAIDDGLEVAYLEEVGMDSQVIGQTVNNLWANKYDQIHSMLVYKDGFLVFEEYFEGNKYKWDGMYHYGERIQWHRDSLHVIMSCTKSFTSACIGIAVEKGYIQSVDESIFKYLPDHQQYNNSGREKITIEHLLTMTSGLDWDEWSTGHGTDANDIDNIHFNHWNDPLAGVLEREVKQEPGTDYTYNSGGTTVLGEVLRNACGRNIIEFAEEYLFEPLGIEHFSWSTFGNEAVQTGGNLKLRPRDMLKFGILYLNDGMWDGQQVISSDWVQKSREDYSDFAINLPLNDSGRNGYAYSWWTDTWSGGGNESRVAKASGWGGQEIFVLPELDMVVVFTGGNYVVRSHYEKIMEQLVLPSIQ